VKILRGGASTAGMKGDQVSSLVALAQPTRQFPVLRLEPGGRTVSAVYPDDIAGVPVPRSNPLAVLAGFGGVNDPVVIHKGTDGRQQRQDESLLVGELHEAVNVPEIGFVGSGRVIVKLRKLPLGVRTRAGSGRSAGWPDQGRMDNGEPLSRSSF